MRILGLIAIGLIILGVLINFVPMLSYFFKTYLPATYKGTFTEGAWLMYYGEINTYSVNLFAFKLNVTKLGYDSYFVNLELYKQQMELNKAYGLSADLFKNATKIYTYSGRVNSSSYPFLKMLFPEGNTVEVKEQNISLNYTIPGYASKTLDLFIGITPYHLVNKSIYIQYVDYGSQKVMNYLSTDYPTNLNLTKFLVDLIFPGYWNSSISILNIIMKLATGNAVPSQDWLDWLNFGFSFYAFPVNVILMVAGAIIAIYYYRRM